MAYHEPDFRPLWTCPTTKVLDFYRQENLEADYKAIEWAQTQPAFKNQDEYTQGLFYLDRQAPEVQAILDLTREEMRDDLFPICHARDLIKPLLDNPELFIKKLPTTKHGFLEHQCLVLDQDAVDLPSGSVRSILIRLQTLRILKGAPKQIKAALNIIKAIRCGHVSTSDMTCSKSRDVIQKETARTCNSPGCARTTCYLRYTKKKRNSIYRNVQGLTRFACKHNLRLVQVVLKTPWQLPRNEKKFSPNFHTKNNRKPTRQDSWTPQANRASSLTEERLELHLNHRKKFTKSRFVAKTFAPKSPLVTEVSFLTPSEQGHRTFPNPHTHIITAIPKDMDINEFEKNTTKTWKKFAGRYAQALVEPFKDFQAPEFEDLPPHLKAHQSLSKEDGMEDGTSPVLAKNSLKKAAHNATANYLKKTFAQTPDVCAPNFDEFKPFGSHLPSTLCPRSLFEVLHMHEHSNIKLLAIINEQKAVATPRSWKDRVQALGNRIKLALARRKRGDEGSLGVGKCPEFQGLGDRVIAKGGLKEFSRGTVRPTENPRTADPALRPVEANRAASSSSA